MGGIIDNENDPSMVYDGPKMLPDRFGTDQQKADNANTAWARDKDNL